MTRRALLAASVVPAVAGYALLWIGYLSGWEWQQAMDSAALDPLHRFGVAHPAWVTGWDVYCSVFSPALARIVAIAPIVYLFVRRRTRAAVFLVGTVGLSGLLTELAKGAVDRPRPATALVGAHSTSFPSGHAVGVMVIVLALLTLAWPTLRSSWRLPAAVLGGVLIVTVGVGRVVLNVHHPSDVLAGWALGYVYIVVWVLLFPPRLRAADGTPSAPGTAR